MHEAHHFHRALPSSSTKEKKIKQKIACMDQPRLNSRNLSGSKSDTAPSPNNRPTFESVPNRILLTRLQIEKQHREFTPREEKCRKQMSISLKIQALLPANT